MMNLLLFKKLFIFNGKLLKGNYYGKNCFCWLFRSSYQWAKYKKEWNTIALALGKNRSLWYKNYMKYIKTMNEGVNHKVDEALLLPKELFSSDNEYDPFAINPS